MFPYKPLFRWEERREKDRVDEKRGKKGKKEGELEGEGLVELPTLLAMLSY